MSLLNKTVFLFIACILFSCSSDKETNDIFLDYLHKNKIPIVNKYIIISEDQCFSCNKKFYVLTQDLLDDSNIVYIITSNGGLLDTRIYENKKNVFFDDKKEINSLGIIQTSGLIILNKIKSKSDTIIPINPNNIENTFERIND